MRVGYNLGMNDQRQKIGRMGEGMAADYLIARGLLILDKNVRTPYGEIDLVAGDGEEVVFVEVKTRTNRAYGYPETAITPQKFQQIVNAAQFILDQHPEYSRSWRIDVVAVQTNPDATREITWFQNVWE